MIETGLNVEKNRIVACSVGLWRRKDDGSLGSVKREQRIRNSPTATPQVPNVTASAPKRYALPAAPKLSLRQRAVALALERGTVRTRDLSRILEFRAGV